MKRAPAEITGTIRGTRSGFAFLIPDLGGEDLLIAQDGLGGAIHGDRVRATLLRNRRLDFRPEVQVEEVLDRPNPHFTGNVFRQGSTWFVRTDSPLLPERLRLRPGTGAVVPGEKVLFRVESQADRSRAPVAVFVEAIGDEADARLDPIVIATEYNLPLRFSDQALEVAAESLRRTDPREDKKREDFRGQLVLTIDPADAKDFDDAVAISRLPEGGYVLTVHIADVTCYVPEGTALDQEAEARGSSVYFPGSVFPMLPEAISSVAASLSPDEDKRVLTVQMRFSAQGEPGASRVARGWMRSRARLHYEQAQAILDGLEEFDSEVSASLALMAELARILRKRRFTDGGFDLAVPETEMVLGPDGVPQRVTRHLSLFTHHLIEEFMIAANRATGLQAIEHQLPFLFRVHEEPDPAALEAFALTVLTLLPGTSPAELDSLPALRRWLTRLPATPRSRVLHRFFLRSLKKAVYSPEDVGHFGLGIRAYCHFTSPIRRYPDLWNHRRLKELLDRAPRVNRWERAHAVAQGSSRAEMVAEEAEREMIRLKAARYMERRLGKEAPGHVTGLTPQGVFVELNQVPIEGFIPRESLGPGRQYLAERMAWVEGRSGWELRPGDPVRVQVVKADLRRRRVEFALLLGPRKGGERSRKRAGQPDSREPASSTSSRGRVRGASTGRKTRRRQGGRKGVGSSRRVGVRDPRRSGRRAKKR